MHDRSLTASRMLMELDFPAGEDDRRQILKRFGAALDPIVRMLTEPDFRTDGNQYLRVVTVHLLARSLSDLLAGGHLASHCYLPQAHSVLRVVIDSCDLLDLFAQAPDQAEKWWTTEKGHVDFAPWKVRDLLGRDNRDPIHSYFSESGSHPRFAGARLSGGMATNPDDPMDMTAQFQVGPIWAEHPGTLLIWPFAFLLAARTAKCGSYLVPLVTDERGAAERFFLRAFLECVNACEEGTDVVLHELGEAPAELAAPYTTMRASAEAMLAELEQ